MPNSDRIYLAALNQSPPFDQISTAALNELFQAGLILFRTFQKGEVIHLQSEHCFQLEVILSGAVAVQNIDASGNLLVVQDLTKQDMLGANLIFSTRNIYPMTTLAMQDTILAIVLTETIFALCRENEPFLRSLLQSFEDRMLLLTSTIQRIAHKSIRNLLVDFIKYEAALQNQMTLQLPMQKKELAERFGIDRTSLSRELSKMRDEGLIAFDARSITITEQGKSLL